FELSFTLHYNLKIENRGEHHSSMMFPSNLSMFFRINGVPEVASSKNKPKFHKNLRSNFRQFLLVS
ncbi:MAG: hypothetical protein E7A71_05210, partial [Enterococcus faecium]|nr:hypothetical protein [Enterococcus faecium]